jgi:hypothetical protein
MTWACPYCGKDFGENPDPSPTRIACCGEVGHLMEVELDEGCEIMTGPQAPDYRMLNEYWPDKARARKRREVWGD